MKFPINISRSISEAGKSSGREKMLFIAFIMTLLNVFIFTQLRLALGGLGIPVFLILIVQILVNVLIVVALVRHFVVREEDKLNEYRNSKDSSLSNFYYVRDNKTLKTIYTAPVLEYTNGNYMTILKFSYGFTNDVKSNGSRILFKELFKEISQYGLDFRVYVLPEKFSDSIEYKNFLNSVSGIKDKKLANTVSSIYNAVIDISESNSEIQDTNIMICTKNPYQIDVLGLVIQQCIKFYSSIDHSFRRLQFMDKEMYRAFIRDYYELEALDLSNLKAIEVNSDLLTGFRDIVKVSTIDTGDNIKTLHTIELKGGIRID